MEKTSTNTSVCLRKTSLIDYPGLICAVIFFPGCNLRCPWCHNRELVLNTNEGVISLENALLQIEKRKNVLGGVVLSGGEPTLYRGLGDLVQRIKALGLKVKLDTNGLLPGVLESLFKTEKTRPDYIAMDLKTSPERYWELLPAKSDNVSEDPGKAIQRSAALIRSSGIVHEFRSLALPQGPKTGQVPYFSEQDKAALALLAGDSTWTIRPFLPGNCLDPAWDQASQINAP